MVRAERELRRWREVLRGENNSMVKDSCSIIVEPKEALAVKLDAIRLERSRSFGAVWLGWLLWRWLKLDDLLSELLPSGRERVSWAQVIAILVTGRLCEPSSELHVAEGWYRTTALEDLLGVSTEQLYDERLYRALDRVLPHKEAIEKHLVKRLGELFDLDYDLLLYDVTSTYFEGVADPEIAQRGYSRDHRPDCVQINIALVVTREGIPLGYELFAGNTSDVATVQRVVESMEKRFGKVNRVWVMDRGMVSAENIAWLNSTGRRYVMGRCEGSSLIFAILRSVDTPSLELLVLSRPTFDPHHTPTNARRVYFENLRYQFNRKLRTGPNPHNIRDQLTRPHPLRSLYYLTTANWDAKIIAT